MYQSLSVPIPSEIIEEANDSVSFLGRLADDIIGLTSPASTIYIPAKSAWYDYRTSAEVASLTTLLPLIESAIGACGLAGLDRVLALRSGH